MDKIRDHIRQIGGEIVSSYPKYPDLGLDRENGILPRDLIFDEEARDGNARGCIVVCLNPGSSDEPEQRYYRDHGCTYESVVAAWTTTRPEQARSHAPTDVAFWVRSPRMLPPKAWHSWR